MEDDDKATVENETIEKMDSRKLSCDFVNVGVTTFPFVTIQAVGKKSEEPLNRQGSITPAPGNDNALIVQGQKRSKPHFVPLK